MTTRAFESPVHGDGVGGLALYSVESFQGYGVVRFRGATGSDSLVSVKVTEIPCGFDLSYIRAVAQSLCPAPDAAAAAAADATPAAAGDGADLQVASMSSGASSLAERDDSAYLLHGNARAGEALAGPWRRASESAAAATGAVVVLSAGMEPEQAEGFRTAAHEALQSARDIAYLSALRHTNIATVHSWHCGVCLQHCPSSAPHVGSDNVLVRCARSGGGSGGGSSVLRLRPALEQDLHSDGSGADAGAPVCLALVTDCDRGHPWRAGGSEAGRLAIVLTLLDAAQALQFLHASGLVHRGLQPSALQRCSAAASTADPRGWACRLADFGFAAPFGAARVSEPLGPLHCIPPEGFNGRPPSPAWDIWAFGVLMWRCVYNTRLPYGDDDLGRVAALVRYGARPLFDYSVPYAYRMLANACWAQDPAARLTAGNLVGELLSLLHSS
ncbi:hypothetical protein GPECTOR_44g77 [Gonium pectorale]|uniref:Protein kinase domain-containing protein n=1 Tax=Gonium pectorale TaxID=33097 RepID=A0A150G977_GONPE|nr:hypothetical protein GPECTOR_44g77 [Gonium pectorale]|eukprot:KXZ46402.1 hypothetical protein GPECTOR_44g77 [Gonium pectorale]